MYSRTHINLSRKQKRFRRAAWDSVPAVLLMTVTVIAAATYIYFGTLSDCHNAALTARAAVNPQSAVCSLLP